MEPRTRKLSKVSELNENTQRSQSKPSEEEQEEDSADENILAEEDENAKKKEMPLWKRKTNWFIDHWTVSIVMTIVTIYALFFDEIRILFIPKVADDAFYALTSIALILFTIEIVLASLAKPGYRFSFFFILDVVSTVSLLTDIGWIMNLVLSGASGILGLAKMSRAGRITRLVRVIRLIRLIRIVKLYKQAKMA